MGLIELSLVILSVVSISYGDPACHMSEAMACLNPIFEYANSLPKRSFVETEDDVDKLCNGIIDGVQCWDKYKTSCMTPIEREIEILFTEGLRTLESQYCTPGSEIRERYLKHAKCYTKITTSQKTSDGVEWLLAILEKFPNLPNSKKAAYACCTYRGTYDYIVNLIKDTCGEEANELAREAVFIAAAQAPDIICSGFDPEGKECKKLVPQEGSKPTDDLKENKVYKWVINSLKSYLDE